MKLNDIRRLQNRPTAPPAARASHPFSDREHLIITYESKAAAIRAALPEPLQPDGSATVQFEFIRIPDSPFGEYTASRVVIPAKLRGEPVDFIAQTYLDDAPPIASGYEIWAAPARQAIPRLAVVHDRLTGTLCTTDACVAEGTMAYRQQHLLYNADGERIYDPGIVARRLAKTQVSLRMWSNADGLPATIQLVGCNLADIRIKGSWAGPARLALAAHAEVPVADLPVCRVISGLHFIADVVLPPERVLHDYLAEVDARMLRRGQPCGEMACAPAD
ncbi:MAG: acetoacetate decarboxylase [Betaproteobacteria bacterium]